ncbi:MAG TPA: 4'-phosphopantetheinyl transferase superfamily protein [Flavilitoribacter sp.]|nr:4'-phosphopantetheinyl transferase superfamily protein [Flavilitoribacter sp.]HMQ89930.1 4'-phosphopantetheinyl transferase superfamily protein [Flavilitoribacter sp.]
MENPLVLIYQTRLGDPLTEIRRRQLVEMIPPSHQQTVNRYLKWEDRQRSLFGKLLVRQIFQDLGVSDFSLQKVEYTAYQRPFFPGNIDFNLSHAGDLIVCAASPHTRLGIDVEQIKSVDLDSFSLVLTPNQQQTIQTADNPLDAFFRLWTLKESVVKANGKGLSIPLNEVETDYRSVRIENEIWHLHELHCDEMHKGYLATAMPGIDLAFKSIDFR